MSAAEILEFAIAIASKDPKQFSGIERRATAWASWFQGPVGHPPMSTEKLIQEIRELSKPQTLDDVAKDKGFSNEEEFQDMTNLVDLSNTELFADFNNWKNEDGTRQGLLKIIFKQREIERKAKDGSNV